MTKPIKLVAVDLDRTVLRSDGTLSPFTIEVFHRLRRCHIASCVLTARRKSSAAAICSQLDCQGAAFYNGAAVHTDAGAIALHPISWPSAKHLLADAKDHPCSVSCKNDIVYTNYETQHSIRLNSWSQLPEQNILRIVLYKAPQELLERLTAPTYTGLYIQQLGHGDIVAVSQLATKEQALKTLLEYWRLSPEDAVGFGDDVNDLGFITLAGTGIAVQNASEQIKQKADIVCGCNDEDGPASWLNECVLRPFGAEVV